MAKAVKNNPLLANEVAKIEKNISKVSKVLKEGIKVNKIQDQDTKRKENLYLSLMSLQEYAAHLSHAVRTSLGKIIRLAEFFQENYPNPKYEKHFQNYSQKIYKEVTSLKKVIDFMLSYAASDLSEIEEFDIKIVTQSLFDDIYKHIFDAEHIELIVEIRDNFILNGNKRFFEDIISNLIDNSIKALENKENKIIKCSGGIEEDKFIYYFSDNGSGIPVKHREKVFEIYYTNTAEKGGAGLGLFIVKTRLEALKGSIEVVDNELKPTGATFKITLPFKK